MRRQHRGEGGGRQSQARTRACKAKQREHRGAHGALSTIPSLRAHLKEVHGCAFGGQAVVKLVHRVKLSPLGGVRKLLRRGETSGEAVG